MDFYIDGSNILTHRTDRQNRPAAAAIRRIPGLAFELRLNYTETVSASLRHQISEDTPSMIFRRVSVFVLLSACLSLASLPAQGYKILEINSYGSDWIWIEEQHEGFLQGLHDPTAEIRSIDLDTKNKDAQGVRAMVEQAVRLIDEWKPDLLFVTDDPAQNEITSRYLGGTVPIVYSGVNADPADYGFDTAPNVTGVLEREHFTATLALLRKLVPAEPRRLAIVIDDDPTWIGVVARIKEALEADPSVEVVSWLQPASFEEFTREMTALQSQVDAVGMIGVFRFTEEDGTFADYDTVLRWTAEHSRLPDFSFWDTRVERGTLCAVTVSGVEQGRIAGAMARRILHDRVSPAEIPPVHSAKGVPMISLARARSLGIPIEVGVLLNARVLPRYFWER